MIVALRKESVDRNKRTHRIQTIAQQSLSARRAWIEIFGLSRMMRQIMPVALRKESVDRNFLYVLYGIGYIASLSARRAWIEIAQNYTLRPACKVALRKESVDRNIC